MTSMNLNAKDIVAIIKQCGLSKVKIIKLGELQISFGPPLTEESSASITGGYHYSCDGEQLDLKISNEQEASPEPAQEEIDLDMLHLESPLEWEKYQTGERKLS
jgi:hypothetical protein